MLTQREGHVLKYGEIGKQGPVLEQHPHAPAHVEERLALELAHIAAFKEHLPRSRGQLSTEQAQDRGLAAARTAHQSDDSTAGESHAHAVKDQSTSGRSLLIGRRVGKRHAIQGCDRIRRSGQLCIGYRGV